MNHDDRNIPLDYQPADKGWLETAWQAIRRLLANRNQREAAAMRRKEGDK